MKFFNAYISARHKAALAALALFSFSSLPAFSWRPPEKEALDATIPALPDEAADVARIREAVHFRVADAPLLMTKFLNEYPSSVFRSEVTLLLADWYFFRMEYPLALKYYSLVSVGAFSGDVRENMLYRKAYSQIKTGFYNEAASGLSKLLSSRRYADDARFYLAYIDYVNGDYDKAYSQFQTLQAAGPKGAEAVYYINQIDFLNRNFQKVATTSQRLLSPGSDIPEELLPETMRVGGLSSFKLGDMVTARSLLSQYVDQKGDGAEISAVYSLASIYYDEGNLDKALPLFSVVTRYPGDMAQSAWLYMGQIYMAQGDSGAAALAFDKAARESWNGDVAETASYNLAVSSAEGDALPFSDAAAAMEDFIVSYPQSPYSKSLSNYLANAYYGRRNYDEALRQIDRISSPDASTVAMRQKVLYQLGVSRLQQGSLADAVRYLSEASSSSCPDREVAAQASLWLGDAFYAQKDYSRAAGAYKEALASGLLGANADLAYYNLGYSYLKLKKYKDAEAAFKVAAAGSGLSAEQKSDAELRYADCLYYTGKYADALAVFRKIKASGGDDAVIASVREADIIGRDGNVDQKISILESLYEGSPSGRWSSTVVSRLAEAYSEKGDDKRAAALYAELLDAGGSDNREIFYSLAVNADNLYKAGDSRAALDAYRRIEASGIDDLYPLAIAGIMRSSSDMAEVADYAAKVTALPGISADEADEARLLRAEALLASGSDRKGAMESLRELAYSPDRLWGARAAVALGEAMLKEGDADGAEKVLLDLIDNGSDDNYWLARGYIALSDVYIARKKDYLARLYLENLRSNYPGNEADILNMISSRLNSLDK